MDSQDIVSIIIAMAKDAVEDSELEKFREKNTDYDRAVVDIRRKRGAERELEKAHLRCDLDYIKLFDGELEKRGIVIHALKDRIKEIEKEIKMLSLQKKIDSRIS